MSGRVSTETVSGILRKALPEGRLHRIPRHPDHRDVVLAMLALGMRRRHAYSEIEINEFLIGALAEFRADVDHVTCRRYMVDLGFVKRDRAGRRYFLNFPKVESTLSGAVMESAAGLIASALEESRRPSGRRKRA